MTVTVSTELENYELLREIGRDELGTVFEGRRKSDEAVVSIKVIAAHFTFDEFFVRRFKDMIKQTARLEHPNIIRTYEAVQEGDTFYVVRELVEGRSLVEIIAEEGSLLPSRMAIIARQIASALDYAHQKSITHGDLAASRVMVGLNDQVTVVDFGQTQTMSGTSLVKQGYAVGSPEVMAPERVRGQGPTRQSDLYSLGILCYQMLAGEPPFTGEPTAILHAHAYEQPRPLHVVNPAISIRLSEAIGRMLSKGLELRYNTSAEFARALSVAIEGTAPMRAPAIAAAQIREAGLEPARPLWKRSWVLAGAAILLIMALLVFGFYAVSNWVPRQAVVVGPPPDESGPAAAEPRPASPPAETGAVSQTAPTPAPTATPAIPELSPTETVALTATPTFVPLPTPGPPTVAEGSPFTNLRLAHGITSTNQPDKVGTSFAPGSQPIYLFFDYDQIEAGTAWTHRWTWGDTELGVFENTWPDNYFESGTAWIFHSPTGGFQPGPYKVTIEVRGQTVATATFVVQPGGL
jgi:hypothetical protein